MASRREFCRGGLALAAVAAGPFTPMFSHAAAVGSEGAPALRHPELLVVADRALREAEPFALEATELGYRVHTFENDLAPIWMNVLEPKLRAGPLAIAGLTSAASGFCLEFLAGAYRARPLARTEHPSGRGAERFATLLASAARTQAALPAYAHVARVPHAAPGFLTWLIATRG